MTMEGQIKMMGRGNEQTQWKVPSYHPSLVLTLNQIFQHIFVIMQKSSCLLGNNIKDFIMKMTQSNM